jgi:hypothetical protein
LVFFYFFQLFVFLPYLGFGFLVVCVLLIPICTLEFFLSFPYI